MDEQQQREMLDSDPVTPDGRWWWDGTRWQPMAAGIRPAWHRRHRPLLILGAILAGLLVVAGVVGGLAELGHQQELARCTTVSPEMASAIQAGSDIPGYQLSHVRAVQSTDFHRIYFISANVSAPGLPNAVGTWASNRLVAGDGLIYAVDEVARASTDWGAAGTPPMTMTDDGAGLSQDCVAER